MGNRASKTPTSVGKGRKSSIPDSAWHFGGPENQTALALRSHDIDPGEPGYEVVQFVCPDGNTRSRHISTTNICTWGPNMDNREITPCPATHNSWHVTKGETSGGCSSLRNKSDGTCGQDMGEWKYRGKSWDAQKCGRIRAEMDGICPHLGKTKVAARYGTSAMPNVDADTIAREIRCSYDIWDLTADCSAVTDWLERRREDLVDPTGKLINGLPKSQWYEDTVMAALCNRQGPSADCPTTSAMFKDTNGNQICSNYTACPICRAWATKTVNGANAADKYMDYWCADSEKGGLVDLVNFNNPAKSNPECKCKRVGDLPKISDVGAPAACWYGPCNDWTFERYLVPSAVMSIDKKNQCPANMCSVWFNLQDSKNIDIESITIGDCGSKNCSDATSPDRCMGPDCEWCTPVSKCVKTGTCFKPDDGGGDVPDPSSCSYYRAEGACVGESKCGWCNGECVKKSECPIDDGDKPTPTDTAAAEAKRKKYIAIGLGVGGAVVGAGLLYIGYSLIKDMRKK